MSAPAEPGAAGTRWSRVRDVFEAALDLEPAARPAYLGRTCADDGGLRDEVERLLSLHRDDDFLHTPEAASRHAALALPGAALGTGATFAGFEILGTLGAGGMGCVYEALQAEPRRRVALKVLRAGGAGASAGARFRWEAELLGRLRHPAIAQVHASGVESDGSGGGVPWFALELVDGARTLTVAAREDGLDRRAVLELLATACDAVQHGHHQGVIHRDLKPANLLVDGEGRLKLIDFGVARLVGRDDDVTRLTRAGDLIGTLGTMAPEQLHGDPDAVDARADVYALGAVLHELLTGAPLHDLAGCSLTEAARRLRDLTPRRPSAVAPGLPEELDWIVTRATAREPGRRYGSASELAADLRRFLARQPVLAGPPSALYRARTFVRRNRLAVAAAAAVLVSLVAGLVGTTTWMVTARENATRAEANATRADEQRALAEANAERADEQRALAESNAARAEQQRGLAEANAEQAEQQRALAEANATRAEQETARAEAERRRAEDEAALARATAAFVEGLIRSPDPSLDGNEVRVVDVLARADEQLALSLAEYPRMAATLQGTLGRLHDNLGLHDEARRHLAAALELATPDDPAAPEDPARRDERLALRASLGAALRGAGELGAAETELVAVHAERAALLGDAHADTAAALSALALLRLDQGRAAEAEALFDRALPVLREALGPTDERVLGTQANLAGLYLAQDRQAEARELLLATLPRLREHLGRRHPLTLTALANLASLSIYSGRLAEGAELLDEVMALHREVLPPDHPSLLADLANLSVLRLQLGEPAEAARLCSELIDTREASDPRAVDVILMRCNRVHMRHAAGDEQGLDADLRALLELDLAATLDEPRALAFVENLSRDLALWGRHEQALALVDTALAGRARLTPDDAEGHCGAWRARALVQAVSGGDAAAELEQLLSWRARLPAGRRTTMGDDVARVLTANGCSDLAEIWRGRCAAADG